MTAKRFTYEYNGNLFDNEMDTFYHIEDGDENIKLLCNRLNELSDENEQLKHELNTIKSILFDLKEIEGYWDSSILQNMIDNIAETVGVDLDD